MEDEELAGFGFVAKSPPDQVYRYGGEKTGLSDFSIEQLEQELKKREHEKAASEEAVRKEREVTVDCPNCGGCGMIGNPDVMRVGSGESPGRLECCMCRGSGMIVAYRKH